MTDAEWVGFSNWQSERLPNGGYRERPSFQAEAVRVLHRARHDQGVANGQMPLFALQKSWEAVDSETVDDTHYDLESFREYVDIRTGEKQ